SEYGREVKLAPYLSLGWKFNTYDGNHSASLFPVSTKRVKLGGAAYRAKPRGTDPLRTDTRLDQLQTRRSRQVDSRTFGRLAERDRHFGAHFKATRPDSGTDRRMQIVRSGIPGSGQCLHGFVRDAARYAAPTSVHGADSPMARV